MMPSIVGKDGFAVCAADIAEATAEKPVRLTSGGAWKSERDLTVRIMEEIAES